MPRDLLDYGILLFSYAAVISIDTLRNGQNDNGIEVAIANNASCTIAFITTICSLNRFALLIDNQHNFFRRVH